MVRAGSCAFGIYHAVFVYQFRSESHHQRGFGYCCMFKCPARERNFIEYFVDDVSRHRIPPVSNQNFCFVAVFLGNQVYCFADESFVFKVAAQYEDVFNTVFNEFFENIIGKMNKGFAGEVNSSREERAAAGQRFAAIAVVDSRCYHTAYAFSKSFCKAVSQNGVNAQRQMRTVLFAGTNRKNGDSFIFNHFVEFHPSHFSHLNHGQSLLC